MSVKLREKQLKDGRVSLYLDIYRGGKRSYRFLELYLTKGNKPEERESDKKTLELGRKAAIQAEYDISVRNLGFEPDKKTTGDFVQYIYEAAAARKETHVYLSIATKVKEFANGRVVDFKTVDHKWLLALQEFLLVRGISTNVARQYIINLGTLIEDAVLDGIIPSNPVRTLPKSKRIKYVEPQRTFLTLEELETLASAKTKTPLAIQRAFFFACFTGLRISDVFGLEWGMIFQMQGKGGNEWRMSFRQKKTRSSEVFPLSAQAVQTFLEHKADQGKTDPNGRVFDLGSEYESTARRHVNRWLNRWGKKAGLSKRLHFHLARHTFATMTLSYGADIYTVSKLLGHKDITTTMIYAKVADRLKDEAVARLPTFNDSNHRRKAEYSKDY